MQKLDGEGEREPPGAAGSILDLSQSGPYWSVPDVETQ